MLVTLGTYGGETFPARTSLLLIFWILISDSMIFFQKLDVNN